jgi:hypothetical protein
VIQWEHTFVTSQGTAYSQFKRALERGNFMLAWTMAAELPKVPLADGLELLLLARDVEPARFDRAVPRWHALLCTEQRLSSGEAQLALAALNALPGPGVQSAVRSLLAVCETHGLRPEVEVLQAWLSRGSRGAASAGLLRANDRRLPLSRQILEAVRVEQRLLELSPLEVAHVAQRRVSDELPDAAA